MSLKVVNPNNQEIVCELSHDEGARLDRKVDAARHVYEKRGRTATSCRRPYRPTFPLTQRSGVRIPYPPPISLKSDSHDTRFKRVPRFPPNHAAFAILPLAMCRVASDLPPIVVPPSMLVMPTSPAQWSVGLEANSLGRYAGEPHHAPSATVR